MSIYVGNLSYEVTQSDISNVFIDALDGAEWMGQALKVSKAKPCEVNKSGW